MAQVEWYNPETGQIEMIDDGEPDYKSPYEVAHEEGRGDDFDRATDEYYNSGDELNRREDTNWYQPDSYEYLINTPGPTSAGPTPTPTPTPTQTPQPRPRPDRSGGPDLGPVLQPYPGSFQAPKFGDRFRQLSELLGPAPTYAPPEIPGIDPFTYEKYTPTTAKDLETDPSYGFRKGVGEQALLNSRAAQGLARSAGTLKDLLAYNQNFASQEFGNVDARRSRDYQSGFGNALEGWRSNADTTLRRSGMDQERARSIYEPQLFEWTQKGNLGTQAEFRARDDAFQEFQQDYNMFRNNQNDIFDRLKWLSEFGRDSAAL